MHNARAASYMGCRMQEQLPTRDAECKNSFLHGKQAGPKRENREQCPWIHRCRMIMGVKQGPLGRMHYRHDRKIKKSLFTLGDPNRS
ncbi:hypothetical protein FKM82_029579 [Ascaphus truei]